MQKGNPDPTIIVNEHHILGKILVANYIMQEPSAMWRVPDDDEIKKILCNILLTEMMRSDMIEFTVSKNVYDFSKHFRARAILMPREDVRFLKGEKLIT